MTRRITTLRTGMPALLAACFATGALAQIPAPQAPLARPKPVTPAQPASDPALEAARAAFEALPEAERRNMQDALVWTGDYNGVTTGAFGRRSFEGIQAYQTRKGVAPTGLLTPPERTALMREAEEARRAARFRVQADAIGGTVIGVPEALLQKRTAIPGGTRWQSADGRVTLDTKSFPPRETSLDTLFERAVAANPGRKVTYKLKKPEFFVVTAETATGRSYLRYAVDPAGAVRGFAIGYDKALAGTVERFVIAIANSFVPFPEEAPKEAVVAAPKPGPGLTGSPALPSLSGPPAVARAAATGLKLGNGQVLTVASALEACAAPRVGGAPARVERRDAAGSLVLLRAEGLPAGGSVPSLRAEAPAPGDRLLVLGAQARGAASVAPGTAGEGGVFAPLQPGAGGAAVLDRSGRLAGLVSRFPAAPRLIAGVMPPTSYAIVPAKAVAAFLAESGVPAPAAATEPAVAATLGEAAAPHLGAIVPITCER
ncbi:peptidoglycan-binding protein [Methylorubrum populi]